MQMFESFLSSIPKTRSQYVSELDIPDDITVEPYWLEPVELPEDSLCTITEFELKSMSTDSSLSMSCAFSEAETDYRRYRKYHERRFSNPMDYMREAQDHFPPGYVDSLNSLITTSTDLDEEVSTLERRWLRNEELLQKMERFFEEECRVFTPDDLGLLTLEEALSSIDLKNLDSDVDTKF